MKKSTKSAWFTPALFALLLLSSGCSFEETKTDTETETKNEEKTAPGEIPEGPSLDLTSRAPDVTYLFPFAHTEDHINHEYSEARYWNVGSYLEEIMPQYPDSDFTWTIQFQGADAQTVYERNDETDLVDYLKGLADKGWIQFGYHGHHEPTYMNRPQNDLGKAYSYEDAFEAISTWVRCEKDPLKGGCVSQSGGGIEAVLDIFGQVELVSGVGLFDGFLMERSAGSDAIHEVLPDRVLGFGFADHGASVKQKDFTASRSAILEKLDPTDETDTSAFWLNNTLRVNDGIPGMDVGSLNLESGAKVADSVLTSLEGTGSHILNTSVVSKYVYTKQGSLSPTQYAYKNASNPELPASQLNSASVTAGIYAKIKESLEFLIAKGTTDQSINFVDSDELVALFVSEDSSSVDSEERLNLALWLLNEWGENPPDWAYDGEDFYTLTESFYVLARGLDSDEAVSLTWMIGPWSAEGSTNLAGEMKTDDLTEWVEEWDGEVIPESFSISGVTWNPAQVLYALATLTVIENENWDQNEISVPKTLPYNSFYPYLEDLGCLDCLDSSWSMKPARFQD